MCVTMSTKILSSYKILVENRASVKRASYSLLLWSVQNWVSGGENTSIYGLHVHQASVQRKERASMSFWFFDFVFIGSNSRPVISLCSNGKTRTSLLNVVSHDATHSRMKANNPFHVDFCVIWYFPDKQLQDVRLLLFFILPADPAGPWLLNKYKNVKISTMINSNDRHHFERAYLNR